MNILLASLAVSTALGTGLLPQDNRIVYDHAVKAAYLADLAADRAWTSCATPEALKAHQREVRARLIDALGGFPARTPLNLRSFGRVERDGYSVERLMFESQPNHHVTAPLFRPLPDNTPGLRPGVLVTCGHSVNGKASEGYQRGALQAAKRGMVALIYDPIDQGERAQCRAKPSIFNCPGHNNIGSRAELLGWNTARFRIWDGMRALDVLSECPGVDPNRLGVMGHSGGGTMTSWIMALDDRVRAAAPSGFLSSLRSVLEQCGPQDAEQAVFGELAFGFNHLGHILLRAPSPVLHCASFGDFFPYLGVLETAEKARSVYAMLGKSEAYRLSDTIGPHHWHESTRTLANDWMAHCLKGCPAPGDVQAYRDLQFGFRYGAVDTALGYEPKGFLHMSTNRWQASVTPTGRTLDLPGERTVYDLMQDEASRQKALRVKVTPELVRSCAGIRRAAEIPYAVRDPHHQGAVEFATLVTDDGTPLPTVTCGAGNRVLFVADVAKRSQLAAEVERLVAASNRVTVVDVRGYGENAKSLHRYYAAVEGDEELSRLYAICGRHFVGKRAEDILVAARHAGCVGKAKLIAKGRAAIAAAHAFFVEPDLFESLELIDPPQSWADALTRHDTTLRFADTVRGAWRYYDWTDLTVRP